MQRACFILAFFVSCHSFCYILLPCSFVLPSLVSFVPYIFSFRFVAVAGVYNFALISSIPTCFALCYIFSFMHGSYCIFGKPFFCLGVILPHFYVKYFLTSQRVCLFRLSHVFTFLFRALFPACRCVYIVFQFADVFVLFSDLPMCLFCFPACRCVYIVFRLADVFILFFRLPRADVIVLFSGLTMSSYCFPACRCIYIVFRLADVFRLFTGLLMCVYCFWLANVCISSHLVLCVHVYLPPFPL